MKINIEEKENKKADDMMIHRWNKWVFAVRYRAGVNYMDYYERTICDKMNGTLF